MKKSKVLKIFLMLAVIIMLCAIGTKANATINISTGTDGKSYKFYYTDVLTSGQLFCSEKSSYLPEGKELIYGDYIIDSQGRKTGALTPYTFSGTDTIRAKRAWAYLFAKNQVNYDGSGFAKLTDSPLQMALWEALKDKDGKVMALTSALNQVKNDTYYLSFWNTDIKDNDKQVLKEAYNLLKEAYQYSEKAPEIINGNNVKINVNDAQINGKILGPFKIEGCGYWAYNNELKAGITELSVLDQNNSQMQHSLFYYNASKEKITINNWVDFNKVMKTGFYVEFANIPTVSSAKISVKYQYLNPSVTIQPLQSISTERTDYSGTYFCSEHKSLSGKILNYNGKAYYPTGKVTYDSTIKNGNMDGKIRPNGDNINCYQLIDQPVTRFGDCLYCGAPYGTSDDLCSMGLHFFPKKTTGQYRYKITEYAPFSCGNSTWICSNKGVWTECKCGTIASGTVDYRLTQKLVYITSQLNNETKDTTVEVDLIPKLEELTLLKINQESGNALKGAKFSGKITNIKSYTTDKAGTTIITTKNDTYTFENLAVDNNGKISIYNVEFADEDKDIVVTFTEIVAPSGYIGMSGEATITIKYNDGDAVAKVDDAHKDFILFDNNGTKIVTKIKNERKPQIATLDLTKIDNDNNNSKLAGAKFSGTVTNIMDSTTYKDITKFEGTTDKDGKITLKNYMIKDITKPITIQITETEVAPSTGFSYKKLDGSIKITLTYNDTNGTLKLADWSYDGSEAISVSAGSTDNTKQVSLSITVPNERLIDIDGTVWRDGDTIINNKTNGSSDGKKDSTEKGVPNVIVYLKKSNGDIVKTTITDSNGAYRFTDIDYDTNGYYVEFEYDGINNIETRGQGATGTDSKASEVGRIEFNEKFYYIRRDSATATDETTTTDLTYSTETENGIQKSTLITTQDSRTINGTSYNNVVQEKFAMKAISDNKKIVASTSGVNLGLVLRGADLAASNKVDNARVTINGKDTTYTYDPINNSIDINRKSSDQVSYNLNIRKSDYMYRIRDYVNSQNFTEKDYTDNTTADGSKSGDELKVYVTYKVDLVNQAAIKANVKQIEYNYDSRYTFIEATAGEGLTITSNIRNVDNTLTINLNGNIDGFATKSIYLVFSLDREDIADNAEYYNSVEITAYSTDEGLIDIDSNPGNLNYNKTSHTGTFEDDSDEAGGVKITIKEDNPRIISGYVFEDSNKNGTMTSDETQVNDVIVQLIELKTINNKQYEYIWEETLSGSNKLRKLSNDGQSIEESTYTKKDGYYEFSGFIPGDYIVRFIYGDGTTYDLTGNVLKYNGQDYKSTQDPKYNEESYIASNYGNNESVARDNEARRLQTMAYVANVDANKGILLKLLDVQTVDGLNEVEKVTIKNLYNAYYDPDITSITNDAIVKLLKEQTLANTWMCAETSTIGVGVDANVNLDKVYFGLVKRPETNLELRKLITGFKLTASNGQVLVNAKVDVNKYFENDGTIYDYIEGIKDSIQAINEYWKYEVEPTTINTVVEGATLEFEYTVVVINNSEKDYLSNTLITAYNNGNYSDYLTNAANIVKTNKKSGTYAIASYLGTYYYTGTIGNNTETAIEITDVRDYIRNDLKYISGTDNVAKYEEPAGTTHYILRDDYSLGTATLNFVLRNGKTSGKLASGNRVTMYAVTLQPVAALSTAGTLDFENYIAEVMSYTNAAGRRATTSTPGNAEIIDNEYREGRTHEVDESATADIQIGAATGEDVKTIYVWLITIVACAVVIAAGAYTTKKFIVKK